MASAREGGMTLRGSSSSLDSEYSLSDTLTSSDSSAPSPKPSSTELTCECWLIATSPCAVKSLPTWTGAASRLSSMRRTVSGTRRLFSSEDDSSLSENDSKLPSSSLLYSWLSSDGASTPQSRATAAAARLRLACSDTLSSPPNRRSSIVFLSGDRCASSSSLPAKPSSATTHALDCTENIESSGRLPWMSPSSSLAVCGALKSSSSKKRHWGPSPSGCNSAVLLPSFVVMTKSAAYVSLSSPLSPSSGSLTRALLRRVA
mmetsp:Transcript_7347/g.16852  ORF Transcript_7347/g.16852 Transcript_7347/m.16852 type:complete len:260 (+) Transcript_7347:633-1412(+)